MSFVDPYHRLGLRRNPFFAPDCLTIDGEHWLDFGHSVAPFPSQRLFVQIIGHKGAGKTTHLLHWQQQTGGLYFYQKPWTWQTIPPSFCPSGILYWDEANRIPIPTLLWVLQKAYRRRMTVVVASHWSLTPWAKVLGFTCKTVYLRPFNQEQLEHWIQKQLNAEKLPSAAEISWQISADQLAEIVQFSKGSWRNAATYLHRWTAQQSRKFDSRSD